MSKLLSMKATMRVLEQKKNINDGYRILAEHFINGKYYAVESIVWQLNEVYNGEVKIVSDQELSSAAFLLLEEIKMSKLYEYLATGHNTVFCIDIAGHGASEKRWYELFTVDFTDTHQYHGKITREVALALDLPAKELKGSGKFYTRYCLEYKGYAEDLIKDLAERLYDDRSCLRSEVL